MTPDNELTKTRQLLYEGKHKEAVDLIQKLNAMAMEEEEMYQLKLLQLTSLNGFAGNCNFNKLFNKIESFLSAEGSIKYPKYRIDALIERMEGQYWSGKYNLMFDTIDRTKELFAKLEVSSKDYKIRKGMVKFWEGFAIWAREGFTRVKPIFEEAEKLFQEVEYPIGLGFVNIALGYLENIRGEPDAAIDRFSRSFENFEKVNHRIGEIWATQNIGISHRVKGNYAKAIKLHKETLTTLERLEHPLMTIYNLMVLGSDFQAQGEPEEALKHLKRSVKLSKETEISVWIVETLDTVSDIYTQKKNFHAALDYAQQSLEISKAIGQESVIAWGNYRLSNIYNLMGQMQDSLKYGKRALEAFEKLDHEVGTSFAHSQIGYSNFLQGYLDSSLTHLKKAIDVQEKHKAMYPLSDTYTKLGKVYFEFGDFKKAEEYLNKSLEIKEENPNWLEPLADTYYQMFKVKNIQNDETGAKRYLGKLEAIDRRTDTPLIDHQYKMAKALLLSKSKDDVEKEAIIDDLREIRDNNTLDYELKVDLDCELSNILLKDLTRVRQEPVVAEVVTYIKSLENMQKQEDSKLVYAETQSLRGYLANVEQDSFKSRNYYQKAMDTVRENKLDRISTEYRLDDFV